MADLTPDAAALRDEWEARWPTIMGDAKATEEFVEKLLATLEVPLAEWDDRQWDGVRKSETIKSLRVANARLVAELDEYEQSFRLYDDAIRRGTAAWRKDTGRDDVFPDTAKLVDWLLTQWEFETKLKDYVITERDRLAAQVTALRDCIERALGNKRCPSIFDEGIDCGCTICTAKRVLRETAPQP